MYDDDIEYESECELYEPVAKKHRETSDSGHHKKSGFNSTWIHFNMLRKMVDRAFYVSCVWSIGRDQEMGKGWTFVPCFTLSKDKIKKHAVSNMHWGAIVDEAELSNGGIRYCYSKNESCC